MSKLFKMMGGSQEFAPLALTAQAGNQSAGNTLSGAADDALLPLLP